MGFYSMINLKSFTSVAALACLLLTLSCVVDQAPEADDPPPVEITPQTDKKQYTVYLQQRNNDVIGIGTRALSKEAAQMGHEFFEVVFVYNNNGTIHTARTSWELGNPSGLSGVYRTQAGVPYGGVNANPANNTGSAVIFVGKKDKTLLGIGRLTLVDGVAGTTINNQTQSVTFEVAALKAGASFTASASSFLTDTNALGTVSTANTVIAQDIYIQFPHKLFPLYKLAQNASATPARYLTNGRYTFDITHSGSIVRAGKGMWEKRKPRYLITEGLYQYSSYLVEDNETVVTMTNNQSAAPAPFDNPLAFTFDTTNTIDGSVFALAFSVPVYALSGATGSAGEKAAMWYIRPGFGTHLFDTDDGEGGLGGSVFIGTGNVKDYLEGR